MPSNKVYARSEDVTIRSATKNETSADIGPTSVTTRHVYFSENFQPARAAETIPGVLALTGLVWDEHTTWNRKLYSLADGLHQASSCFLEKFGLKLEVCVKRTAIDDRNDTPRIVLSATGNDRSERIDHGNGLCITRLACNRLDMLSACDLFGQNHADFVARRNFGENPVQAVDADEIAADLNRKPANGGFLAIGWNGNADADEEPHLLALDASEDPEDAQIAAGLQICRIWN